uniref:Minor tail protein n=1 Tax=virus sp. ctEfN2 TaxID=2825810 RepID=A0A8S5RN44_9VIRU|nr:MAG TPA: minor tail protein [virus sp. ctEfN2]
MPDNTIDSLAIEVSSNVSNASKSIDDLCNKLNRLSSRMSESIKHLRDFSASVGTVNSAVQALKLDRLDLSTINSQLQQFTQSMSALGSLNLRNNGLNSFVNAIRRLNEALNSTGDVSGKIQKMISELSGLSSIPDVSNNVNRFVSSLARLANAGSSIDTVASKLPNLGEELGKITASFSGIGEVSQPINTFVQSIAQLANAGDKTKKTSDQLENLSKNLKSFFQTMSTAPKISRNTIQMTQAIAQLANAGGSTGRAAQSTVNAFSRLGQGAVGAVRKVNGLGSAIGNVGSSAKKSIPSVMSLAAKFWALKTAATKFTGAIESSMNFLEDYNYFQAAFRQVADKAGETWSEAGYDSAEAYANSFSNRARELTSKMSGFDVSDNAILTANKSGKSLGMDPSMLLNYQGQFAQLSSSMGTTSEQALKLSNALTMIGADLASVKNLDFSTVYENLSSGLVGMSRAVDKYGANIRVANLQQYASNLGLQTAVSKMDQASKAMLRTIVILDSTRYAWADMANTINMPANQLRILRANLVSCARALGNIFMPVIAAVLPYINGLVIAFQRLLTYIGSLLGVDTKIGKMFGSIGGGSENLSNALDSIDDSGISDVDDATKDTDNNLKNATKSAKKLKQFLASYDELEIMSKDDSSLSDLANSKIKTPSLDTSALDAGILNDALNSLLDEYQKKWDAAYNSMENKAMAFANKVTDAFKKLAKAAEPTTKALKNLWNNGLKQLRDFTWTALKDFWNHFLVPLGKWTLGEKGLPRLINAFNDFLVKINWDKINASLVQLWDVLEPFAENVGTGLLDFFDDFFDKAADGVNKLPDLIDRFKEFIATFSPEQAQSIGYFLGQLLTAFVAFKGLTWFGSIFGKDGAIGKGIAMLAAHPYASIAAGLGLTVAALDKFGVIDVDWEWLWDKISQLKDTVSNFINNVDWSFLVKTIGDVWDVFQPFAQGFGDAFVDFFDVMVNVIGAPLINALAVALEALAKVLSLLDDKQIEALGYALGTFLAVKGALKFSKKIIGVVSSIRALKTIFGGLGTVLSTAGGALKTFFGSGLGSTLVAGFADSMTILAAAMAGFNLGKWISVNLFGGEDKTFGEFLEDNVFGYQKGDFTGAMDEWLKDIFGVGDKLTEDDLKVFQEYEDAILSLVRASQLSGEQAYPLLTFLSELKDNGYSTEQALFELELKLNNLGVSSEDFENAIAGVNEPVKDLGDTAETSSDQFSKMAERINNVSFEDISEQLTGFQNLIQTIDFATLVTDTANAIDQMGGIWENGKQILGEKALQIYQEIAKGLEPDDNGYYTLANGQMVQFGKGISDYESTLQSTMDSTLQGAINGVLDNNSGFELFAELGKNQIVACGDGIMQNSSQLTGKLNETITTASSQAGNTAKTSGKEIGENSVKGILQGYESQKGTLGTATQSLFEDYVKKRAQESLDSHSPSRWFEQLAKYCGVGFQNGLEPGFSSSFTWFGRIRTRISNSIGNLYNVGWNSIIGLNNGIVGAAQQLYANVQKIAQNISNTFRKVLKIHSPSQVMMELGGFTVEGFQLGMQNMLPQVRSTINDISAEVQKINTPTADIITKSASYQEVKSRMSVDTDDFVDDIRKEIMAISSNTFDNNQMIGQAVKNALNGMAIYADGHLIGYLKEENQQFRNRNGYGILEG